MCRHKCKIWNFSNIMNKCIYVIYVRIICNLCTMCKNDETCHVICFRVYYGNKRIKQSVQPKVVIFAKSKVPVTMAPNVGLTDA